MLALVESWSTITYSLETKMQQINLAHGLDLPKRAIALVLALSLIHI